MHSPGYCHCLQTGLALGAFYALVATIVLASILAWGRRFAALFGRKP